VGAFHVIMHHAPASRTKRLNSKDLSLFHSSRVLTYM
jgi:hypothetical protein